MSTTISVAAIAPLLDAYSELAASPSAFVTHASAGTLNLTIGHDEPGLGDDVSRALWPPLPADAAVGHLAIRCLSAADPRVASLVPPAPEGVPRVFVDESHTGQRWLVDWFNGLHVGADLDRGTALVIWDDRAYGLLTSAPFRTALQWLATRSGALLLHAAAVGRPEGGLLLLGPGQSGKSTTALAVVAAGGVTAGDDYVWVPLGHAPHEAYSCYRTVKTRHSSALDPFGVAADLPGFDVHYAEPKRVHHLAGAAGTTARVLPLLGAAVLTHGAPATTWRRISTTEAVLKAAPSTIFQASGDRAVQMPQISALLGGLPCFEVAMSPHLPEVGGRILDLIDHLSDSAPAR